MPSSQLAAAAAAAAANTARAAATTTVSAAAQSAATAVPGGCQDGFIAYITTGARVPDGATGVIKIEDTEAAAEADLTGGGWRVVEQVRTAVCVCICHNTSIDIAVCA